MAFKVIDGIEEKAAAIAEKAEQAKAFANEKMDAAANFVCVQILNVYTMVYLTAGQVVAIPAMAMKLAKSVLSKIDKDMIKGVHDSFSSSVSTLVSSYTNVTVKYDPEAGTCVVENKPSKIAQDPSKAEKAVKALQSAQNCPLLQTVTGTAGFESTFSAAKLLEAMTGDDVSPEEAAEQLANSIANTATETISNLASAVEDTAFGALNGARSMYKAALQQSGIEAIFTLLGQGQSCLMDLCDDDSVLKNLENMPLAPYLKQAGGFVEEKAEKVNSSYFTFTFDFDKSTGADKVVSDEEQIDTTVYAPLPVINGLRFSNIGIEGAKNVAGKSGYFLPSPYDTYYKAYMAAKDSLVPNKITDATQAAETLHIYTNNKVDDTVGEFFLGVDGLAAFKSYVDGTWDATHTFYFADYLVNNLIAQGYFLFSDLYFSVNFVSDGNTILDALSTSAVCIINTEAGTVDDINNTSSCCFAHVCSFDTYKDTAGKQHAIVLFRKRTSSDYKMEALYVPTFFKEYTTTTIQKEAKKFVYVPSGGTGNYTFFAEPAETADSYAIFPFKKA